MLAPKLDKYLENLEEAIVQGIEKALDHLSFVQEIEMQLHYNDANQQHRPN